MLYFVERQSDKFIKIGITINFHNRIKALRREHGGMELIAWLEGYDQLEEQLHYKFRHLREDGEFFRPEKELVDFINANACPIPYSKWESSIFETWQKQHAPNTEVQRMKAEMAKLENENLQLKFDIESQSTVGRSSRPSSKKEPVHIADRQPIKTQVIRQEPVTVKHVVEVVNHANVEDARYQIWKTALLDSIEDDINEIRKQLGLQPIDTKKAS